MIIANVNIFNGHQFLKNANSILVKNGKIAAIGENLNSVDAPIYDGKNQFIYPGFIEGHGHFIELGKRKFAIELSNCESFDEILHKLKTEGESKNSIVAEGWHQEKWHTKPQTESGFPTYEKLNELFPNKAVALFHASKHAVLINKNLEEKLSIASNSGILIENDVYKIRDFIEEENDENWVKYFEQAQQTSFENGIVAFYDAFSTFEDLKKFKALEKQEKLKINLWLMLHESLEHLQLKRNEIPFYSKKLKAFAIKRFMDGAIGNRGALFKNEYSDAENVFGEQTLDLKEFELLCDFAATHKMQMCTHAIGDLANHLVLNVYENAIQKHSLKKHNWRIEHAQHLLPNDIDRFAKNKIVASIQACHCTSDAGYVLDRIGNERAKTGAYKWQTLWQSGALLNNGTDCPIEEINPIENIYSTVARKCVKTGKAFFEEEKLTRLQALQSYTINNAKAAFQEKDLGSIDIGKCASFTLLNENLIDCSLEKLKQTITLATFVDGELLFEK